MLNTILRKRISQFAPVIRQYSTGGSFEHIIVSKPAPGVRLVQLNRPKALNALCTPLILELNSALEAADKDSEIGAIVITGSEKSFAAGADIKEMKDKSFADAYGKDFIENWSNLTNIKKPIIAAVNGYAVSILFFFFFFQLYQLLSCLAWWWL